MFHNIFFYKENISLAEGEFHLRSKFHIRLCRIFHFLFCQSKIKNALISGRKRARYHLTLPESGHSSTVLNAEKSAQTTKNSPARLGNDFKAFVCGDLTIRHSL